MVGRRATLVVGEECSSTYNIRLVFCICMLDREEKSGRKEGNLKVEKMNDNLIVLVSLNAGS